ncbi:MAG: hypothetical protein KDI43_07100, partial [Gammaproteobacteria bacterium]|nr:hypothetical protein [Gammaproteobacteria bacterium]
VHARTLKCADRISNLTDLHRDTHPDHKITDYLIQTEQYILPMAREVNSDMVIELTDLIKERRKILRRMMSAGTVALYSNDAMVE